MTMAPIPARPISFPGNTDGDPAVWQMLIDDYPRFSAGVPCEGDFDGDNDVDGSDLAVFVADFGRTDCATAPPCEGDFDGDNDVDGNYVVGKVLKYKIHQCRKKRFFKT